MTVPAMTSLGRTLLYVVLSSVCHGQPEDSQLGQVAGFLNETCPYSTTAPLHETCTCASLKAKTTCFSGWYCYEEDCSPMKPCPAIVPALQLGEACEDSCGCPQINGTQCCAYGKCGDPETCQAFGEEVAKWAFLGLAGVGVVGVCLVCMSWCCCCAILSAIGYCAYYSFIKPSKRAPQQRKAQKKRLRDSGDEETGPETDDNDATGDSGNDHDGD
eukprot:TRINITY_DN49002_c0_g1_i1.p1 TRINITY_DN49002_c0_g1~~TRINITY_DN49002_c0_g1_i1.p1  ORF type:complete len:216 (-),score=25.59 TRINITY_DN49002_c0_g1_i1:172-819(-)